MLWNYSHIRAAANEPVLLEDSKLMEMAKRLNKSPAQIVLRFQIQRNVIVIPKSVTPSRIQSNFQVCKHSFVLFVSMLLLLRAHINIWMANHRHHHFNSERLHDISYRRWYLRALEVLYLRQNNNNASYYPTSHHNQIYISYTQLTLYCYGLHKCAHAYACFKFIIL